MLSGDSLHGNKEIFQGSSVTLWFWFLTVTEVVESFRSRHQVVSTTHDTEDTKRPNPGSDNSNNVSPVLRPPTKQGETSGNDINNQDSTRQLPRWNRRPEWTLSSSNENQPIFSLRNLQEQNTIQTTKVLNNTTLWQQHGSQSNPRTDSQNYTQDNGHTP